MKKLKVLVSLLMVLIFLVETIDMQNQTQVKAIGVKKEEEDNNTSDDANVVKASMPIKGRLNSKEDKDYYKYKSDTKGNYKIGFENISGSDDVGDGWNFYVYDENLNELCHARGVKSKIDSYTYDFKKGTVLYIMVEASNQNAEDVIDIPYKISAKVKKSTAWEIENNDSVKEANKLNTSSKKYGNLYLSKDEDYYVYTVSKSGSCKFTFENESGEKDCGYGWVIDIYDSNLQKLDSMTTKTQAESQSYSFSKGTKIYVKVAARYHSMEATNLKYSIAARTVKSSNVY